MDWGGEWGLWLKSWGGGGEGCDWNPKRGEKSLFCICCLLCIGCCGSAHPPWESGQQPFPEQSLLFAGAMVSKSCPGPVPVFPQQKSVLKKRKAGFLALFLYLLGVVLGRGCPGERQCGGTSGCWPCTSTPGSVDSALFQRRAVVGFNSLYGW